MKKLECAKPCREGPTSGWGCRSDCAIRKCILEKGLDGCWVCSSNRYCNLLEPLKKVTHDWNDEQAIQILKNCRGSLCKESRLLIIERIIPSGNEPSPAKLMDIVMLVNLGGQERTLSEYERLLNASGFKLQRIISTNSAMSIIEAMPVQ